MPRKKVETPIIQLFTNDAQILLLLMRFETATARELAGCVKADHRFLREQIIDLEKANLVRTDRTSSVITKSNGKKLTTYQNKYSLTQLGVSKVVGMREEIENSIVFRNKVSKEMAARRG